MNETTPRALGNVITIDDERIKNHLDRVVRGSVEETLNALLDAEADRLCNAQRYERTEARRDSRAGHYERKLQTKAGEVKLRIPKLRMQTFETAIIRAAIEPNRNSNSPRTANAHQRASNRADTVKRRKWRSLWLLIYRRTFLSEPAAKHAAAIALDWFEKQGKLGRHPPPERHHARGPKAWRPLVPMCRALAGREKVSWLSVSGNSRA
jgi:hypothetical protein